MHPIRPHFLAHVFVAEPTTDQVLASLRMIAINRAALTDFAIHAPLIGRFFQIGNAFQLAAERASVAGSHAMVMINEPALIWMLSPDFAPMAAVAVP